jgi:hypothetical protein
MMSVAYALKKTSLAFGAAILWVVFAIHCYGMSVYPSTEVWDIYYGLVWLGVGMVLLCTLEPAIMKPRKQDVKEDVYVDDIDKAEKEYHKYKKQTRIPRFNKSKYDD